MLSSGDFAGRRASHRELDPVRSRPNRPFQARARAIPVQRGVSTHLDIEIWPSATLFEAGSELIVEILGHDAARYPALRHSDTVNSGAHTIHTGSAYTVCPGIQRPAVRRPYAAGVAMVDPDDDTIARWVVAHYRYDPDRRERRHVVVAAFDNPHEFHADIHARAEQLRARRESGEDVDRLERITGRTYAAGYRRQQRDAHLLRRAIEHGVAPVVEDLDLPPNVSAVRAVRRSPDPG